MANFGTDDGNKGAYSSRSVSIDAASAGNPQLRAYLQSLEGDVDAIHSHLGTNRQLRPGKNVKAPDLANATLAVVDGKYVLDIIPSAFSAAVTRKQANRRFDTENLQQAQQRFGAAGPYLLHQIQTSTTTLFDLAGTVATYGGDNGDPALHWEIHDPNTAKYVRFRSRFSNSTWNAWQYLAPSGTCGAQQVYSGVLRSLANNVVNQALTFTGANPLTQVLLTKQIAVAASIWTVGSFPSVNYSSGSVTPTGYGLYYVYADDPRKAGGAVTFLASLDVADTTADDGRIFFGKITTAAGGGGTGSGGGSGACCIGECEILMADGSIKLQKDIRKGDLLMGADGMPERVELVELIAARPCFTLGAEGGRQLRGCSSEHPLRGAGGQWEQVFNLLQGDGVAVWQNRKRALAEIQEKRLLGNRTVYRMKLSRSQTFIADSFVCHNQAFKG